MKNWLTLFYKDMRFLGRKSRRSMQVILRPSNLKRAALNTGRTLFTANGKQNDLCDPLKTDTMLNGQTSHYQHQNLYRMHDNDHFYKGDGTKPRF